MEPESFETMKCLGFLELVRLYCTAYFLLVSTKIIKLHLSKYTIIHMQINKLEILSQKPAKISTIFFIRNQPFVNDMSVCPHITQIRCV